MVLIARESIGCGVVEPVHNLAHPILRLPRLTGIGIQVRHVLNGLVAVGILAHIGLFHLYHLVNFAPVPTGIYLTGNGENGVYLLTETFLAAKETNQSVHIVEYRPDVMPGTTLGIGAAPLDGRERLRPRAVGIASAEETDIGVPKVDVVEHLLCKDLLVEFIATRTG